MKNFNLLNKNTKQLNLTNYPTIYKYRNVEKIPTKNQIHSLYRSLLRLALDTEYKIKVYSFNIYKNSPSFLEQFYHKGWEKKYMYSQDLTLAEGLPEIYDDLNFEQANLRRVWGKVPIFSILCRFKRVSFLESSRQLHGHMVTLLTSSIVPSKVSKTFPILADYVTRIFYLQPIFKRRRLTLSQSIQSAGLHQWPKLLQS